MIFLFLLLLPLPWFKPASPTPSSILPTRGSGRAAFSALHEGPLGSSVPRSLALLSSDGPSSEPSGNHTLLVSCKSWFDSQAFVHVWSTFRVWKKDPLILLHAKLFHARRFDFFHVKFCSVVWLHRPGHRVGSWEMLLRPKWKTFEDGQVCRELRNMGSSSRLLHALGASYLPLLLSFFY